MTVECVTCDLWRCRGACVQLQIKARERNFEESPRSCGPPTVQCGEKEQACSNGAALRLNARVWAAAAVVDGGMVGRRWWWWCSDSRGPVIATTKAHTA